MLGNILEAAVALPGPQLVLSVGRNLNLDDSGANSIECDCRSTAPQIELLMRVALSITHAGVRSARGAGCRRPSEGLSFLLQERTYFAP